MLQIKNFRSMFELQDFFQDSDQAVKTIADVYRQFRVCKTVQKINSYKQKGFIATDVLMVLLLMSFSLSKSVYGMLKSGMGYMTEMEKDVYYRLKNNPSIDWRFLLFSFVKRFRYISQKQSCDKNKSVKCLIVDDVFLGKTGKSIEKIGKVYDHVLQKYLLGFKMLTLGFWDGKSFLPLDFSFHSEKGKNKEKPYGLSKKELKARYRKKRDKLAAGYKRMQEVSKKKTEMAKTMLKRAVKHGFIPDYVLMDKWFISEDMIRVIRKLKKGVVHLIAACKKDKRKYSYRGKQLTAKQILALNKSKIKHCRTLKMLYIPVVAEYKGIKMFLFFNKPNRRKHWELLVTTDLNLSFKKALETYSIRWTIEVFFKECKQHLGLGKCQSNDFDAQIADTTITLMRYILLNLMKRFSSYETLGEAFSNTQIFMLELNLSQKIWNVFVQLCRSLCDWLGVNYNEVISVFFQTPKFQESIFRFFDPWEKVKTNKELELDNAA